MQNKANNFDNAIASTNNFDSFKYNSKLIGSTANEILEDTTVAVSLKYLGNFWRSGEMSLINCKVELKLRWTNHCVLAVTANDNNSDNPNRIIFTIKDSRLYVPVVALSAKDNQKLSKLFSKIFERSVYWNEYTTKMRKYEEANNFEGANSLFVLVYPNRDNSVKIFNAEKYYLPKGIIKNSNVIINGKNFYDQLIDSDIKRYEEIKKLTTEQDEDYTTVCLLDMNTSKIITD